MFVAIGAAATAAGAPRQGVAFLGGYAFGAVEGTLLALAAQVVGCAVVLWLGAAVGRGWAERRLAGRFGHRLRPLRDVLAGSPFGATLALRLLPVGNNLALNLLAGMAGVSAAAVPGRLGARLPAADGGVRAARQGRAGGWRLAAGPGGGAVRGLGGDRPLAAAAGTRQARGGGRGGAGRA